MFKSCMLKKSLLFVCLVLSTYYLYAQQTTSTIPVIFDTDMGPDYDDVGAIALLHALADRGEAEILATIASTKYEGVAAVLHVLNTYFNKPDIPIGVPHGEALTLKDSQHWTDTLIANYPHQIQKNSEVPSAVEVYRKILAQQADNSVTIITVGFLTNVAALLQSPPDTHSALSGKELVKKKVKKLVSMAGKFPSGLEFNIEEDAKAAQYAFEHWEKPVLFSGFEIGHKIKTGLPLIQNDDIQNSPVKDVYRISIPKAEGDKEGRMSWDQTAVLVAIRGHQPYYKLKSGRIEIDEEGNNQWSTEGNQHQYLIENRPVEEVQQLINELMMHQPEN
jgi:pyrimidine-specific ribonucleoside hydrolase